jgi:type IV pilus assembly protein PilX
MKTPSLIFENEHGSTIIVAMLILVFLTIIGISAINTSRFESQIAGNEHRYQIAFYLADSGWKEAAMWLQSLGGPPEPAWTTDPADPPPDDLDSLTPDNATLSQYGISYWYQVQYSGDNVDAGSNKSLRRFWYRVESNANRTQEIETTVSKLYKVGY